MIKPFKFEIDSELLRQARAKAALAELPMAEILRNLIKTWLEGEDWTAKYNRLLEATKRYYDWNESEYQRHPGISEALRKILEDSEK